MQDGAHFRVAQQLSAHIICQTKKGLAVQTNGGLSASLTGVRSSGVAVSSTIITGFFLEPQAVCQSRLAHLTLFHRSLPVRAKRLIPTQEQASSLDQSSAGMDPIYLVDLRRSGRLLDELQLCVSK